MTLSIANRLLHVLAAVVAVAVARRRADYRSVAGFLVLSAVIDVGRGIAREHGLDLSTAHAHEGWARVAVHVDQAAYLTWPAAGAWLAAAVFGGPPLRRVTIALGVAWFGAVTLLVAMYPASRGSATNHAFIAAELASTFFSVGAIARWWARREAPTLAHGVALLICGIHAVSFAVVARGYTLERWRIAVGAYVVLYVVVVLVQGGALWTSSSQGLKSPRL